MSRTRTVKFSAALAAALLLGASPALAQSGGSDNDNERPRPTETRPPQDQPERPSLRRRNPPAERPNRDRDWDRTPSDRNSDESRRSGQLLIPPPSRA
jgi:hypothetical protein